MEYPIRKDTSKPGFDYEIEVSALFAIKCILLESIETFFILTNVDDIGDTDDIVLCITTKQKDEFVFLLQLKHGNPNGNSKILDDAHFLYKINEKKRNKKKERFSIDKYCRSYRKFKINLKDEEKQSDIMRHLQNAKKFFYVIYTTLEIDRNIKCFKKIGKNESEILEVLSSGDFPFYKFSKTDSFHNNCYDNVNDFLENLYLFPNQAQLDNVRKLIKKELMRILLDLRKCPVLARPNYLDETIDKFIKIFKQWSDGCEIKNETKYIALSKKDISKILADILLEPCKYEIPLTKSLKTYYTDCPNKVIWSNIMLSKDISLVFGNESMFEFLIDYIKSETLNQMNDQKVFDWLYTLPNYEIQILKLCNSNLESITSAYKWMWFYKQLPLLLAVDCTATYENILKILKIGDFSLKVIILTRVKNLNIRRREESLKYFTSFKDLDSLEQLKILDLPVKFQGRITVCFSDILKKRKLQCLKCDDIINILCGNFNVGYNTENICNYYIDRKISIIKIKFEALIKVKYEHFVIETKDDAFCRKYLAKHFSLLDDNFNNLHYISIIKDKKIILKLIEKLKITHKTIHWLVFREKFLEWRESIGAVKNILEFQIDSREYSCENSCDFLDNIHTSYLQILSARSGMGKSVLLNYISCCLSSCVWILPVVLRNINENIDLENNPSEFFTTYEKHFLANDPTVQNLELSRLVFNEMLKDKRVWLLLDGFDEVSILYKSKFTKLIQFFQQEQYPTLITTREHMRPFLEKEFNIFSRELKPFDYEEQKLFLRNFLSFSAKPKNDETLFKFVEEILNASKKNLSDKDLEFTEIPLQLKLLANYFLKEYKIAINTGKVSLHNSFDLLDLYEKFIYNKTNILCEKFGEGEKQSKKHIEEDQDMFALRYLFSKHCLEDLNIESRLQKYCEDEFKSQLMQKEGILIILCNQNKITINFIHRTFAEYLAAKWLARNVKNPKFKRTLAKVVERRFSNSNDYVFIFTIFDRILAKQIPIHLDIINVNVNDLIYKLTSKSVTAVDQCNRTVVHMLCLYSHKFERKDLNEILNNDQLKNIELETLDHLTNYSPLDYAIRTKVLEIANKLCEFSKYLRIRVLHGSYREISIGKNYITKYKNLGGAIFHNRLCTDFLIGRINEETQIYEYLNQEHQLIMLNWKSLYGYVKNFCSTVGEYLEYHGIKEADTKYYYDIRFAIAVGTIDNITNIFTPKDFLDGSLLYYATAHKRLDIVKFLLGNGSDVHATSNYNITLIHEAARVGCDDILRVFIDKNVNLNSTDDYGITPLEIAIDNKNTIVANTIMKHNPVINGNLLWKMGNAFQLFNDDLFLKFLKASLIDENNFYLLRDALEMAFNNKRMSLILLLIECFHQDIKKIKFQNKGLLYWSARLGTPTLLNLILDKFYFDDSVDNKCNVKKISTKHKDELLLSVSVGNMLVVEQLIENGLDINERDSLGNTPLLMALQGKRYNSALFYLLAKNVEFNIQNNLGYTTLHYAVINDYQLLVDKLLNMGVNVNVQNNLGYTSLHYASMYGYKDVVIKLLNSGGDINIKTKNSDNALLLALKNKFLDTAETLISNNSNVNNVNNKGMHALHYAALAEDLVIIEKLKNAGATLSVQIKNNDNFWQNNTNEDIHHKSNSTSISTPYPALHQAILNGNVGAAKLLISCGANVAIKTYPYLNSALHYAAMKGCNELILELIDKGLDINDRNRDDETPLYLALRSSNLSTAKLLRSKGSTLDMKLNDENKLIELAIYCDYTELVSECINRGYDINKRVFEGSTPLELAIRYRKFDTIKLLIEKEAIPSIETLSSYVKLKMMGNNLQLKERIKYFQLLLIKYTNINQHSEDSFRNLNYLLQECLIFDKKRNLNRSENFAQEVKKVLTTFVEKYEF